MINLSGVLRSKAYKKNTLSGVVLVGMLTATQLANAATTINANSGTTYVSRGNVLQYRNDTDNTGIGTWGPTDFNRQILVFEYDRPLVQNTGSLKLTFKFGYDNFFGAGNTGSAARNLSFWDVDDALALTASTYTGTGITVSNSFQDLGSCTPAPSATQCGSYAKYTMPVNTVNSFAVTVYLNQQAINKLKSTGRFAIGVDATVNGGFTNAMWGRASDAKLVAAVPLPPAALLFGPAVLAVGAVRRKQLLNKVASV